MPSRFFTGTFQEYERLQHRELGLPEDIKDWTEAHEQVFLDSLPSYCPGCGKRKFSLLDMCPACSSTLKKLSYAQLTIDNQRLKEENAMLRSSYEQKY